ncbi:unnamed protein product [Penicillium glandicola]
MSHRTSTLTNIPLRPQKKPDHTWSKCRFPQRVEGRDDVTPLHLAVDILEPDEFLHDLDKINRETEISGRAVEFLLKNGADPNGCGPAMQRTPFAYAVSVGNVEAGIVLFGYGATVDKDKIIPFLTYDPHDWTHLLRRLGIE